MGYMELVTSMLNMPVHSLHQQRRHAVGPNLKRGTDGDEW